MTRESVVDGAGWAATSLDAIGEGPGFRKIRAALGVNEMGVNAIVLPPRYQSGVHWHERQEEVYFVHDGTVVFVFGDGDETREVGAGGVVRVDAATHRRVRNESHEPATIVVFGAQGGYVGRDGQGGVVGQGGGPLDG